MYKQNLTKDDRFEMGASQVCRSVLQNVSSSCLQLCYLVKILGIKYLRQNECVAVKFRLFVFNILFGRKRSVNFC